MGNSPDKLRLLKSTLRTGSAVSENNVNKFMVGGFSKRKNLTEAMNNSIIDSSMYSATRRGIEDNTTTATPMKAVHPTSKHRSANKSTTSETRYTSKTHTMPKLRRESPELKQNPSKKDPTMIKIRTKKSRATASKVMQMLSSDPPEEDEGKYLATKDIQPLEKPEKQFKLVYKDL